jgi:hypothetical protein
LARRQARGDRTASHRYVTIKNTKARQNTPANIKAATIDKHTPLINLCPPCGLLEPPECRRATIDFKKTEIDEIHLNNHVCKRHDPPVIREGGFGPK